MRRGLLAVVACALAGSAAGAGASERGVLRVVAIRGPVTPVCIVGVPCDGPAVRVRVSVRRQGVVVGREVTDARGRARFALVGGRYLVTATFAGDIGPQVESRLTRVTAGHTTTVRFSFDTGIR